MPPRRTSTGVRGGGPSRSGGGARSGSDRRKSSGGKAGSERRSGGERRSGSSRANAVPRPARRVPVRPIHPPVDAAELEADFQACRAELIQRGQALSEAQFDLIRRYGDMVVTRSAILNLISPGDRQRVFTRHIVECLSPALVSAAERCQSLVDIGSGAGFPGIPLAIAVPGLRVLLVEPRVRRSQFLEATTLALGLGDRVEVFQGSAERLLNASQGELGAGLATARAVDRLEHVWTWASGLLRAGGELAMYRAPGEGDEALSLLQPAPSTVRREPLIGHPRELLFLTLG